MSGTGALAFNRCTIFRQSLGKIRHNLSNSLLRVDAYRDTWRNTL